MKIKAVTKTPGKDKQSYTKVEFENSKGQAFEYEVYFNATTQEGSLLRNGMDYAGLWFENNRLVDYDMVFALSKAAIITIRKAGLTVPKRFEYSA